MTRELFVLLVRIPVKAGFENEYLSLINAVIDEMRHQAAHAVEHVDTRVVAAGCEFTIEHDVTVENRSDGIRNRIVHIVSFNEHCVERRDAAGLEFTGSLQQLRQ